MTKKHWEKYGRNYYARRASSGGGRAVGSGWRLATPPAARLRYDYEGVDKPAAEKMMAPAAPRPARRGQGQHSEVDVPRRRRWSRRSRP